MNVAVIACGKIGLPLAVQFARSGAQTVGVDVNDELVATINRGAEPHPGETDLGARLDEVITSGRLRATTAYSEAIPDADVVVVVAPLVVDGDARPDFAILDSVTASIGEHLTPGTLVIYETTLPVGTTRTRWAPQLEAASGLTEGEHFDVAFSPERVMVGRIFADLRYYPKLVGALSSRGAKRVIEFYESVLQFDERDDLPQGNGVWDLGSAEAAEFAKLAETTYRDVNIGLANQFARFADRMGIDIGAVINATNSQPSSHIHRPGVSVGGHCIPVYPRLYLWNDPGATIVAAAREANVGMTDYTVGMLEGAHGDLDGTRVVVLGAAYRGAIKETAFSGAFPLVRELAARGAVVLVHDPLFTSDEIAALGFAPYEPGAPVDAAILHTDHRQYRDLRPSHLPGIRTLIDGRRLTSAADWPGVAHRAIGGGTVTLMDTYSGRPTPGVAQHS